MTQLRDLSEVRALLQLDAAAGVGLRTIVRLVEEFGSAADAMSASPKLFDRVCGSAGVRGAMDAGAFTRIDDGLSEAVRLGMTVRSWRDAQYPEAFHRLADPPPVLFLRGNESLLDVPGVTIVGARRATERGRDVAYRLGQRLVGTGLPVVSGMALGIDAAAHWGALEAGGATIAVLGRGADRAYPRSHARLFRDIVRNGLVVSEFLPGTPALPHHFPRRNRLLAALGRSVVVVEAARKSGSLITMEHALDLGLDVFAVPGPIDVPSCEGSNALLGDGALPLVSIEDFARRFSSEPITGGAPPALDAVQRAVYSGLASAPRHVDEVAGKAGLSVPDTLAVLVSLELLGCVEQRPGLRFRHAA